MQDQNNSAPALFRYDDETAVRVVTIDGEPWFVLNDLCRALGMARSASQVADRLDKGVRQTYPLQTAGGTQQATIVSEPGMYEVVLRSDKPEAVAFRRWLTGTVLPEIRKTGSYGLATVATLTPLEYARKLVDAEERAEADRKGRAIAETKLAVERKHRAAIEGGDGIDPTTFGKKFFSDVRKTDFDKHLYDHGYLINQLNTRVRPDGSVTNGYDHRKPTAKGRRYFYAHDTGNHGGRRRSQPRVRPQMEIELRDALAAEGLPVNEHSTGLVLITNDEIRELGA